MGQKVNPIGLRIGVNRTWDLRWYAKKDYAKQLHEDLEIKRYVKATLSAAEISNVIIERPAKKAKITIFTAKPGAVIGKKGSDVEKIQSKIANITKNEVFLNIVEVKKPEVEGVLVAENIARQIEKRVSYKRAMKRAIQSALKAGALGVKISCSGRLGGVEIARTEWYKEGRIPLHTLRANIDYGIARANTTYGVIGVKVWIFKGEYSEQEVAAIDIK